MAREDPASAVEDLLRRGVADGSFPGAQLYASVAGSVVADVAVGEARLGVEMTTATIVAWGCNTKPVTAVAALQLRDRGLLDLDQPVATYVPGYERYGKQGITVRHLLTHTAGFAYDPPFSVLGPLPFERVRELAVDAWLIPGWVVGSDFRYSAFYGYSSVAVVVSQIDGRPFDQYVREEIFEPLRMDDCWIGVDRAEAERVSARMSLLYDTSGAHPEVPPFGGTVEGKDLHSCSPGTGGIGPMRQLGRFWEALRSSFLGSSPGLLSHDTVREMAKQGPTGFGLGLLVAPGYYGNWCPSAFGHDGMTSTLAFYDPGHDLVVVGALNGMGRRPTHRERIADAGRVVSRIV